MKLSDILFESKDKKRFILQGKLGKGHYEVYENGVSGSIRCATIHFSDDAKAFERAKLEANK